MTGRRSALLLTAAFLLCAAWSLVVPINEAPDEPAHWQYARFLHDRWTLPHYAPGFEEANSPPLAYVLFAPFAVEDASPDMAPTRRIGSADVVAPWSMRDVSLYGDPFVRDAMRHAVPYLITDRPLWSPFFVTDFPRWLGKSFIGVFGWAGVTTPPLAYRPYVLLFAVGLGGGPRLTPAVTGAAPSGGTP